MPGMPNGKVPLARYWIWVSVVAGLVGGFLVGKWWAGLLIGIAVFVGWPILYGQYLRRAVERYLRSKSN